MNALRAIIVVVILAANLSSAAQQLRVATYNIRYKNANDSLQGNGWHQRYPVIAKLIQFHDFDILGTQEGQYVQQEDLLKSLPGYTYIGGGRDDGKQGGEYASIFYKINKFSLLKQGTFWFAPVTSKPAKGWDAMYPRTCSWAQFRDKKSGFKFYFFNLHLDHVGVKARLESAKLLLVKIKEIAGKTPVIITGDFNADQHNETYSLLNTSEVVRDVYDLSPIRYATNGTFNQFDPSMHSTRRIDHIFVTPGFKAQRFAILGDTYFGPSTAGATPQLRLPSDHFPAMVVLHY
ncbi:endonuclease [Mucilaginibacter hurinus]|uniref:Endonuclease n=1 Tax=Mucilaginibacter hurinus TaxID=2201324 RepID=A0A367GT83_9SPHI|nr:endonuclease/exonuclease/phosphatase family protein [Mucilaginibacter hurinus]RCH56599.1 endonuclease [Mucilaginibacter hurinus]